MAADNQAQQTEEPSKKKIKLEENDDKPIYNPKNVPLGWDGRYLINIGPYPIGFTSCMG